MLKLLKTKDKLCVAYNLLINTSVVSHRVSDKSTQAYLSQN